MLRMILKLQFLLYCLINVNFTHGVDFDYYFSALRSKQACDNIPVKINCQIKCGVDTGMCIGSECYCLSVSRLKKYGVNKGLNNVISTLFERSGDDQSNSDFQDYNELPEFQYERRNADLPQYDPKYLLNESLLSDKPMLRHHIAHFCPNLDVARTCIRKCMTEGKPAFCGKDHVCYCGHRYSSHDTNSEADATSIYSQFKDLYEKYFGPNYKQEIKV